MSDPYKKASPGDPVLADDWNGMQVMIRDHVLTHDHGGTPAGGRKLTGDAIDAGSSLSVTNVVASARLLVQQVDVFARLNELSTGKLDVAGGTMTGKLTVSQGGLTVEDGGLTVSRGGMTVSGGLTMDGDLRSTRGNLSVEGELSVGAFALKPEGGALRIDRAGSPAALSAGSGRFSNGYAVGHWNGQFRIVYGLVNWGNSASFEVAAGSGFSVRPFSGDGVVQIDFEPSFGGPTTITATQISGGSTLDNLVVIESTASFAKVRCGNDEGKFRWRSFTFIAMGP
jgi:hypothetical protein